MVETHRLTERLNALNLNIKFRRSADEARGRFCRDKPDHFSWFNRRPLAQRLNIVRRPAWWRTRGVEINGEVQFPEDRAVRDVEQVLEDAGAALPQISFVVSNSTNILASPRRELLAVAQGAALASQQVLQSDAQSPSAGGQGGGSAGGEAGGDPLASDSDDYENNPALLTAREIIQARLDNRSPPILLDGAYESPPGAGQSFSTRSSSNSSAENDEPLPGLAPQSSGSSSESDTETENNNNTLESVNRNRRLRRQYRRQWEAAEEDGASARTTTIATWARARWRRGRRRRNATRSPPPLATPPGFTVSVPMAPGQSRNDYYMRSETSGEEEMEDRELRQEAESATDRLGRLEAQTRLLGAQLAEERRRISRRLATAAELDSQLEDEARSTITLERMEPDFIDLSGYSEDLSDAENTSSNQQT